MRIYLVGFMGAGKTTVAKTLSQRLLIPFVDLDTAIEMAAKESISEIFKTKGEDSFRVLESQTLKEVSATSHDIIISTGGGTPCFNDNLEYMLANGVVVYLKLTPKMLLSRLENAKHKRPLLQNKSADELLDYIEKTLAERELCYNRANIIVDNSSRDISSLMTALQYYQNNS